MGDARTSNEPPDPKEPSGLPPESSAARRRAIPPRKPDASEARDLGKRPVGLKNLSPSARLRLQLALDHDDDDEDGERPVGLPHMTTSARQRLELALELDSDEVILPPSDLPRISLRHGRIVGQIPFNAEAQRLITSLMRWVMFCGLLTLTVGMLTGLSYLTGPGSVAHMVVGILAIGLSVWLLSAAWSFRRVVTSDRQQHHLVNGLGLVRSALLLKAILLFSTMVLGCFTFSVATAFLSAL